MARGIVRGLGYKASEKEQVKIAKLSFAFIPVTLMHCNVFRILHSVARPTLDLSACEGFSTPHFRWSRNQLFKRNPQVRFPPSLSSLHYSTLNLYNMSEQQQTPTKRTYHGEEDAEIACPSLI